MKTALETAFSVPPNRPVASHRTVRWLENGTKSLPFGTGLPRAVGQSGGGQSDAAVGRYRQRFSQLASQWKSELSDGKIPSDSPIGRYRLKGCCRGPELEPTVGLSDGSCSHGGNGVFQMLEAVGLSGGNAEKQLEHPNG